MFLEWQEVHLAECLILVATLLYVVLHREGLDQGEDKPLLILFAKMPIELVVQFGKVPLSTQVFG